MLIPLHSHKFRISIHVMVHAATVGLQAEMWCSDIFAEILYLEAFASFIETPRMILFTKGHFLKLFSAKLANRTKK